MTEVRWTWELGAVIRGDIKREVMKACVKLGLQLDITESKSLLSSLYVFRVVGPDLQVRQLVDWVKRVQAEYLDESADAEESSNERE